MWAHDKQGTIAIFPPHIGDITQDGEDWKSWVYVNKVIIRSFRSELDMEYLADIVAEVLANHQCTNYWWHKLDNKKVSNNDSPPYFQTEGNIYSYKEGWT